MTKPLWPELVVDVARLLRRDNIAELKRRPTDRPEGITVNETVIAAGLEVSTAEIPEQSEVQIHAELRPTMRGIDAAMQISSRWEGECRRCLDVVSEEISLNSTVSFLPDIDSHGQVSADEADAYPIVADRIDLGVVLREELMLSLPLSPLCGDECTGADPERFPTLAGKTDSEGGDDDDDDGIDPRWAGLSALTFDED